MTALLPNFSSFGFGVCAWISFPLTSSVLLVFVCRSSTQSADRCLFPLASTTSTTWKTSAGGKAGVRTIWHATQYVALQTLQTWNVSCHDEKRLAAASNQKIIWPQLLFHDIWSCFTKLGVVSLSLSCFLSPVLFPLRSCMPTLWCTATITC